MKLYFVLLIGLVISVSNALPAQAQSRFSEADRKITSGRILLKWGGYAEKIEGQDRRTWAATLWPSLAAADLDNLHKALQAVTYEGMRNALLGQTPNDAQIIDRLARTTQSTSRAKVLGSLSEDLVFTPINPCRVVDSRVGKRPLKLYESRMLDVSNPGGSFAIYGGSNTDCGIPANPAAVSLSFVVLPNPRFPRGFVRVYPYDAAYTEGSTVIANDASPHNSNDMIVRTCQGCTQELRIYSAAIDAHYAVFVTGYFMAPHVTPLDCQTLQNSSTALPGGGNTVVAAVECPTGYASTGLECFSDNQQGDTYLRSFETPSAGTVGNAGCVWTNKHATESTPVRAVSRCCRLPGR